MNRLAVLLLLATVGCQSVKRLTEGSQAGTAAAPVVIHGGGTLGPTPTFNVPIPAGTSRVVIHQFLPANGLVTGLASPRIDVFMKDEVSGAWFHLGTGYSGAWYYTSSDSAITVRGNSLDKKEICIYEYVAEEN